MRNNRSQKNFQKSKNDSESHQGFITFCTRRSFGVVDLNNFSGQEVTGRTLSKFADVTVGDLIEYQIIKDEIFITKVNERKNLLWRSYLDRIKTIAANIDHIFIVTAYDSTYNPLFIDKVALIATLQEIPFSIVFNKSDLKTPEQNDLATYYKNLGFSVIETIAKNSNNNLSEVIPNISQLTERISPVHKNIVFCGVSGSGKSSLLNALCPTAKKETQDVSDRTGQGKQTTTLAKAQIMIRDSNPPLLIIDTPGIQNFGLSLIEIQDVQRGYPEILELGTACKFRDCLHFNIKNQNEKKEESEKLKEEISSKTDDYFNLFSQLKQKILNDNSLIDVCAVVRNIRNTKDDGDLNSLSFQRYLTYCHILQEANQLKFFEKKDARKGI